MFDKHHRKKIEALGFLYDGGNTRRPMASWKEGKAP